MGNIAPCLGVLGNPGKAYMFMRLRSKTTYLDAAMAHRTIGLVVLVVVRVAIDDLSGGVVGQGGVVHAGVDVCHFGTTWNTNLIKKTNTSYQ